MLIVGAHRYTTCLQGKMPIVLLTNDADNRRKAVVDGLDARGVLAYARSLKVWAVNVWAALHSDVGSCEVLGASAWAALHSGFGTVLLVGAVYQA